MFRSKASYPDRLELRRCVNWQVSRAGFYRSLQERVPVKEVIEVRFTICYSWRVALQQNSLFDADKQSGAEFSDRFRLIEW